MNYTMITNHAPARTNPGPPTGANQTPLAWVTVVFVRDSQMPSSRPECGKKLRDTSPSRFVSTALHKSLLQAKYVEYCM